MKCSAAASVVCVIYWGTVCLNVTQPTQVTLHVSVASAEMQQASVEQQALVSHVFPAEHARSAVTSPLSLRLLPPVNLSTIDFSLLWHLLSSIAT